MHEEEEKLEDVHPEEIFMTGAGHEIKNLKQLLKVLNEISEDSFNHHVNEKKNDFANWVRDVFENKELASELSKEKTKEGIINVLDIYLSQYLE